MYKINLHAHSRWSDGSHTIRQMAEVYKDLDFSCAVLTDHVYSVGSGDHYSLNTEKFQAACCEAQSVSQDLDFPIFLGAEFGLGQFEETLVYGTQAVKFLISMRDKKGSVDYKDLRIARHNFNCAAILAHPIKPDLFVFEDAIDGFELMNHGRSMFTRKPIPPTFKNLTPWSNSDAHCDYDLGLGWNIVNVDVKSEAQLINLIKRGVPLGFDGVEWETIGDLMLVMTE
jgi:hypothetical protein